jgi:hypothetical protein
LTQPTRLISSVVSTTRKHLKSQTYLKLFRYCSGPFDFVPQAWIRLFGLWIGTVAFARLYALICLGRAAGAAVHYVGKRENNRQLQE